MRDQKYIDYINAIYSVNIKLPEQVDKETIFNYLDDKGAGITFLDFLNCAYGDKTAKEYKKLKWSVNELKDLSSEQYMDSAIIFPVLQEKLSEFQHIEEGLSKLKEEWINLRYKKAIKQVDSLDVDTITKGIAALKGLEGYSDKAKTARRSAEEKLASILKKHKNKRIILVTVPLIIIAIIGLIVGVILPNQHSSKGDAYLADGQYDEAIAEYERSGNKTKIAEGKYYKATELLNSGNYEEAKSLFSSITDYGDSSDLVFECDYQYALSLLDKNQFGDAKTVLETLENKYTKRVKEIDYGLDYIDSGLPDYVNGNPVSLYILKNRLYNIPEDFSQTKHYTDEISDLLSFVESYYGNYIGGRDGNVEYKMYKSNNDTVIRQSPWDEQVICWVIADGRVDYGTSINSGNKIIIDLHEDYFSLKFSKSAGNSYLEGDYHK